MMKEKLTIVCAVIAALVIGYGFGYMLGRDEAARLSVRREVAIQHDLLNLDRAFFASLPAKPGTLASGNYTLEVNVTTSTKQMPLKVEFTKGQVSRLSGIQAQDVLQSGNIISWDEINDGEMPWGKYIGFIDGNVIWGRVYRAPGEGWHEGEPAVYGTWILRPTS